MMITNYISENVLIHLYSLSYISNSDVTTKEKWWTFIDERKM